MQSDKPLSDKLILLDTFVKEYWGKKDKRLQRILKVMDQVEFWVPDDDEDIDEEISEIGVALADASEETIESAIGSLITALAYMSSSKSLRILAWLEDAHPDLFRSFLLRLDDHTMPKAAKLSSKRMKVIQSLNLMGKVFHPNRSQRIVAWLREQGLGNDSN
jgi:hypothetical protein